MRVSQLSQRRVAPSKQRCATRRFKKGSSICAVDNASALPKGPAARSARPRSRTNAGLRSASHRTARRSSPCSATVATPTLRRRSRQSPRPRCGAPGDDLATGFLVFAFVAATVDGWVHGVPPHRLRSMVECAALTEQPALHPGARSPCRFRPARAHCRRCGGSVNASTKRGEDPRQTFSTPLQDGSSTGSVWGAVVVESAFSVRLHGVPRIGHRVASLTIETRHPSRRGRVRMLSPEQRRLASCRLPPRQPDHHRAARRIIYGLGRVAICSPERTTGRCRHMPSNMATAQWPAALHRPPRPRRPTIRADCHDASFRSSAVIEDMVSGCLRDILDSFHAVAMPPTSCLR